MSDVGETALAIVRRMKSFGSGEMAALRRMTDDGSAPAYWRLGADCNVLFERPQAWVPIVRAVALLSDKGAPEDRGDLHGAGRKLGAVLCDGGDPDWPGTGPPRPMLSEARLAQLLAARGRQRTVLLTRAVRALAARRPPRSTIDVVDLAWAHLAPDRLQTIAEPYYRRLDRAEAAAAKDVQDA